MILSTFLIIKDVCCRGSSSFHSHVLKISILTPETFKETLFIYENISIKCEWKCDIPSLSSTV